jgi:hypothetical protein
MTDETRAPDYYDRRLSDFTSMPEIGKTKLTPIRVTPPLAVGGSQLYTVQTFRTDKGETLFLEVATQESHARIVLPPEVTRVLYRQRESLIAQARRRAARQAADTREAKGIVPTFGRK